MKKKILSFLFIAIMVLAMGIQVSAAEIDADSEDSLIASNIEAVTSELPITRAQGDYTVTSCIVYPANLNTGNYYSPYTSFKGGAQTCSGTLSTASASSYSENNCNGFRVEAYINAGPAKTYKLYINDKLDKQGAVPSQSVKLSINVKNNNPGNWRLVLYSRGDTIGIPVSGRIYLN